MLWRTGFAPQVPLPTVPAAWRLVGIAPRGAAALRRSLHTNFRHAGALTVRGQLRCP